MHRPSAPRRKRPSDRVAEVLLFVFLGGFLVAFERFVAGSWRHLGAVLTGMAVVLAGSAALDAVMRRNGYAPTDRLTPWWVVAVMAALGAAGGVAYALVETGRIATDPVLSCASTATVLALFGVVRQRRQHARRLDAPAA